MTDDPWDRRLAGLETSGLDGDLTLHVARSYRERRRGLAKMAPLPDDHALHILRTNSVHTFGMRFPLDLVWLGRRGQVLRVDRGVPARRMKTCVRARSVIETPAGQGDRFARALDPA
ncbi:MAG TPA: DUF192 domain-containing protein [Solirubrobacteraceae bacterium]|nr:DUF192 domain-containing protein [Solirubrobacteraceae bacterium]